jgi:hypothetical protein
MEVIPLFIGDSFASLTGVPHLDAHDPGQDSAGTQYRRPQHPPPNSQICLGLW